MGDAAAARQLAPSAFDVITFDCYGTLVDWEAGILSVLAPLLARHGRRPPIEEILVLYAELESEAESGDYTSYRSVLVQVVTSLGRRFGFEPTPEEKDALWASIAAWLPYPDSVPALLSLKRTYKLGIISNVDDDLFVATARRLEVDLDWVVTASQVRAYKPSPAPFTEAMRRIGIHPSRILHAAQSLHHDVATAKALGLATVWVDRRRGRPGSGATPASEASADWTVPDMRSLAALLAG